MATAKTPDDESALGEVEIAIVVVPGRVRTTITRFLASQQIRAGLVSVAVIVALAAGAIVAVSSSSGPRVRSHPNALATQFGVRSDCSRLTVVSPDGAYARIDLDRSGPCGTFGSQVTLILHRLHGVWVREFEAATWTCPMSQLPRPVAIELRLCRSERHATSTS